MCSPSWPLPWRLGEVHKFFLRCMSLLASVVLIIIISFQDLEITKEIREKLKSLSQVEYCHVGYNFIIIYLSYL